MELTNNTPLPIRHGTIAMEAGHRDLGLEGMPGGFGFVHLDSDAWRGRRVSDAALDQARSNPDIVPPRDIAAHHFLDQIVWCSECDLRCGGYGDGSLRVVAGH